MSTIREIELSEVISSLPEARPYEPLSTLDGTAALFLCALGFEDRCLVVPRSLAEHGFSCQQAVHLEYATNLKHNSRNRTELVRSLRLMSRGDVHRMPSDVEDFPASLRSLLALIVSATGDKPPVVVFDISVAANRLLMTCMKVLLEHDVRLRVLYSEAARYYPTEEDYNRNPSRWESDKALGLERGVSDVKVSPAYPGCHVDQLPDCVVLFPSFKRERANAIISYVDPSLLTLPRDKVIWLLGKPHLPENQWRINAMRFINRLVDVPNYEVSTFDYKESLCVLHDVHRRRVGRYRFTLAPIGSKMSALGAALFCYIHPDVRILFATPKEYNARQYSDGCVATWMVDFGDLSRIRDLLDKVGLLVVKD